MHTIVLATQKGGSGKSTLAVGLTLAAQQSGHNVRLIETDPQGTLSNWQGRRGGTETLVETILNPNAIEQRLQELADSGVTLAIVDTAGGISATTTAAIRHCDICLIPARPSVIDIEASAATIAIVKAWQKMFAFVLNQTPIRGQRIANAATTLGSEAARDLTDVVANPFIVMRNDHQDALAAGLCVSEFAPAGKSTDEIRSLWQWVETRLNGGLAIGAETAIAMAEVEFPIILAPERIVASAETSPEPPLAALDESLTAWDAGL